MILISYIFAIMAILFQMLNFVWIAQAVKSGKQSSQILLAPVLLWYIAMMLNQAPLFFSSNAIELGIVLSGHVAFSFLLFCVSKFFGKKRESES